MKFVVITASVLFVLASTVTCASVEQVKDDIKAIDSKVDKLYQQVKTDSLNYFTGLAVHNAAQELIETIRTGSKDVKGLEGAPTEHDAKQMLEELAGTEVKVKDTVKRLILLEKEFDKLGVLRAASQTVNDFEAETVTFSAQLVNVAPMDTKQAAKALALKFREDLKRCVDAYDGKSSGTRSETGSNDAQAGSKKPGMARQIKQSN